MKAFINLNLITLNKPFYTIKKPVAAQGKEWVSGYQLASKIISLYHMFRRIAYHSIDFIVPFKQIVAYNYNTMHSSFQYSYQQINYTTRFYTNKD
ncbi:MAG: hypothetical protein IPJ81_14025 [Chitinophagaceae bacterium]|nr:hypothetical protein [Chitinophagaceae bacterium]